MLPRKRKNWKGEAKNPTPNFILDLSVCTSIKPSYFGGLSMKNHIILDYTPKIHSFTTKSYSPPLLLLL